MSQKSSLRWKELPANLQGRVIGQSVVPANQPSKPVSGKVSKYHNVKCEYHGIKFDSHKERDYYIMLLQLQNIGEVIKIELQVCFPYCVKYYNPHFDDLPNGEVGHISFTKDYKYISDFRVTYSDGRIETVDIKGNYKGGQTKVFRTKKMIIEKLYHIEILIR